MSTLVLSIVCILCGVVLGYLQPTNPIATTLIVAGAAALGVSNHNARQAVEVEKKRANEERARADDAMNTTQQILLDKLPKS